LRVVAPEIFDQFVQARIGYAGQVSRRVTRLASDETPALQQRDSGAGFREQIRGRDTRNATADDGDIDLQITTQGEELWRAGGFGPIRSSVHRVVLRLTSHTDA
jgi:hypothetical protein